MNRINALSQYLHAVQGTLHVQHFVESSYFHGWLKEQERWTLKEMRKELNNPHVFGHLKAQESEDLEYLPILDD